MSNLDGMTGVSAAEEDKKKKKNHTHLNLLSTDKTFFSASVKERKKEPGVSDWLTLSAGQTVTSFQPVAEQSEGAIRGRARQVNHLHAGLQRKVMTQVLQMLHLSSDSGLGRHLFKKRWYSERKVRRSTVNKYHYFVSRVATKYT